MSGSSGAAVGATDERTIRVFVSSTFRDFQGERDWLVKRVFPRLREVCERRGVVWGEVDLRWGVTDEQRAEGRVLPICLEEIRGCRPYFIGLLGERYGWVPESIDSALVEREPWLVEHRERSVTELEFVHGVLADPALAEHAFFYFRDPGVAAGKPELLERPSVEELTSLGVAEAERRADERRRRLAGLKERVRASGLPVREGFGSPEELGELVERDLLAVVDRLFPEGSEPDPLEWERLEHEAFARSRTGVYIGRREYFNVLDEHAAGEGPPLAVLGEAGSGKSALLSNWAFRYREAHPAETVIVHFVGSSSTSADWASMLRRLLGELERRFQLGLEIPDEPQALRLAFANALHMAAARGRLVLIVDALNQLEDREGALDLVWLPPVIPTNVRLVVSTLPGRPLDDLGERGWPTLTMKPLTSDERKQLIADYLGQYRKALSPTLAERVIAAPQTENPLFLRALLDELRLHGEHETLPNAIRHYLEVETVDDLYEKVFERWERDYQRDRPGLVRDALSLIWAARRGLSETELLHMLGSDDQPLPQALWAPLHLAARPALINRQGLLAPSHDYLRQAIHDRYLRSEEEQAAAHLKIADHYAGQPLSPRHVDEYPWQLAQASAWERLFSLLQDFSYLEQMWDEKWSDVRSYWSKLEQTGRFSIVDAYPEVIANPHPMGLETVFLARLLTQFGYWSAAERLYGSLADAASVRGDAWSESSFRNDLGEVLRRQGRLDAAMAALAEAAQIARSAGDVAHLQLAIGNEAIIHGELGDRGREMELLKEQERLARASDDRASLHTSLGNQAGVLLAQGRTDDALSLLEEKIRLCHEIGDIDGLASGIGNHVLVLLETLPKDAPKIFKLLQEQEQILRQVGARAELAENLTQQAYVSMHLRGDMGEAIALQDASLSVYRASEDKDGLAEALRRQAAYLNVVRDHAQESAILKERCALLREMDRDQDLAETLANWGVVLRRLGRLEEAKPVLEEQEDLSRRCGLDRELGLALEGQAAILLEEGDGENAIILFKQAEDAYRAEGNWIDLSRALGNKAAAIVKSNGGANRASDALAEAADLCRDHGDSDRLGEYLDRLGELLISQGQLERAKSVAEELERVSRAHGVSERLQRALEMSGTVLAEKGEHGTAMAAFEEQAAICRSSSQPEGLARALIHQAMLMHDPGGQRRLAVRTAEQARDIAIAEGLIDLSAQIDRTIARLEAESRNRWFRR